MKNSTTLLSKTDIANLDIIIRTAHELGSANETSIGSLYSTIGDIFFENIIHLNLDEDINQLLYFARNIACEVLSNSSREKHFGNTCWEIDTRSPHPPFFLKLNGHNASSSEVRTKERTIAAMMHMFAWHLRRDPILERGANALLNYERKNGLWSEDEEIEQE